MKKPVTDHLPYAGEAPYPLMSDEAQLGALEALDEYLVCVTNDSRREKLAEAQVLATLAVATAIQEHTAQVWDLAGRPEDPE